MATKRRRTTKKRTTKRRSTKRRATTKKRRTTKKRATSRKRTTKRRSTTKKRRTTKKRATSRKRTTKRKSTAKKRKTTKRRTKTKRKKTKSKRKPNPAFMRPLTPSSPLSQVIGSAPLPRTQAVKKMWTYIKKHGLQDSKNRRNINADAKLRPVFGKATVTMFEMTKILSKHLK